MRTRSNRAIAAACAATLAAGASAQVTEFPLPTPMSRPYTIVAGPDGNLWFTESNGNRIGRITTAGAITEFPVPTAASGPYGIAVGAEGDVWFTERFGNKIGRFTPSTGVFREYRLPTAFAQPWEIALGPDGNLWFTEEDVNQIGRITPGGMIREFPLPACCFPTGITAGADGRLWFTLEIGDQIGRVELSGAVTMFPIASIQVLPWDIAPGIDGGLWFTELAGRALGRISLGGQIVEHPIAGAFSGIAGVTAGPDGRYWFTENDTHQVSSMDRTGTVQQTFPTGQRPLSIASGPDGNLWFTEADGNAIGRITVAPPGQVHVLALDAGYSPRIRFAQLGERVQFTFLGPSLRSVSDVQGLGLFDSGPRGFVSYYRLVCLAAGTFVYGDGPGAAPSGAIVVPVELLGLGPGRAALPRHLVAPEPARDRLRRPGAHTGLGRVRELDHGPEPGGRLHAARAGHPRVPLAPARPGERERDALLDAGLDRRAVRARAQKHTSTTP
jgi:streptogramin lyase